MITKEENGENTRFTTDLDMLGKKVFLEKEKNNKWRVCVDSGSFELDVKDGKFGYLTKEGFIDSYKEPHEIHVRQKALDGNERDFALPAFNIENGEFQIISLNNMELFNKICYKDGLSPDGVYSHYEAERFTGWKKLYSENLYTGERTDFEYYPNGGMKSKKLSSGTESRWDEKGNLIYHATKGREDTKLYLAKQKLAQKQVAKSDELREKGGKTVKNADGTTRQQTVVKKMGKLEKAVKLPLAMLRAKRAK